MSNNYRNTFHKIQLRLAEEQQPLPDSLSCYKNILAIMAEVPLNTIEDFNEKDRAKFKKRMARGQRAIHFKDLHIKFKKVALLASKIGHVLAAQYPEFKNSIQAMLSEIDDEQILKQYLMQWYNGKLKGGDAATDAVHSIIHGAFYPFLYTCAEMIEGIIPRDTWSRSFCPACGGRPDFSLLDKEKGARWLICSRCDTRWEFPRIICPFCGNTDHSKLSYITDEQAKYRLYLCDACHGYIKCKDARKDEEILVPLERILTTSMDRQALDMQYKGR